MMGLFTRQIQHLRRGRAGQSSVLLATTVAAVLSLVFATIYVTHQGTSKVAAANAVDAIALSAATWEARGLNMIAALNDGILQCLRLIRWTSIVWASLAAAACFGTGLPAFLSYTRHAVRIIRSSWGCARELSLWSERIRKATPGLVLAETYSLSRKMGVTGVLRPGDPGGTHDGENTIELHLCPGPPISLAEAIAPIRNISAALQKFKWAHQAVEPVTRAIDAAVRLILGQGGPPLRMLVPENDFERRQKVRFAGSRRSAPLPIPDRDWSAGRWYFAEASARPYGGGAAQMTWKSRIVDVGEEP